MGFVAANVAGGLANVMCPPTKQETAFDDAAALIISQLNSVIGSAEEIPAAAMKKIAVSTDFRMEPP